MTTFDDREQAFENKFARDAELRFQAEMRCNKKLGLWAADLLGKSAPEAGAYVEQIIRAELDAAGHAGIARVAGDLGDKASVDEVARKRAALLAEARKEILDEG
ncbi:DUF1476 domain-containing protein [Yangia mangrovi]|uniref:Aldolase n=1 Tax=Alloyangia mangrovi TaxID=1779329 RepID=A0A2A3JY05_9RHOB|nr:DUF1476 domain-containing protein [Alloyangia mangrovi]MCT4373121.1 DUF1476 domain-containing protein [Alloyangia mangrovi]